MLLSAEHLSINFGSRQLLDDVNFYLNEGDKVGVIGINGTGKSTFLKVLSGVTEPDGGTISRNPNVQVSLLPQNPAMEESATVLEQVFLHFPAEFRELNEYEAKAMLNRLGITDFAQKVGTLSGGQRKRVALAAALIHPADVLILDEPTNHLDSGMADWLEEYLKSFRGALLMITHDLGIVAEICDEVSVVYAGRVVEHGTLADVFDNTRHPYTEGLFNSLPNIENQAEKLKPIRGLMPDPTDLPLGCPFYPRCDHAMEICRTKKPPKVYRNETHFVECHLYNEQNIGDKEEKWR